ncbi:glycoside hydrolase family protein [Diaphorobacter caeni]|uniref:glycoside hydrolase family protein n=1 Tax=Diaphorobacter caeni TaxID=2784387 RepID=UPI00188FDB36|nr:endolysin [Diaphorobacter caeni]MBF5006018.1 endolysin [Diaphorobacter caeni]
MNKIPDALSRGLLALMLLTGGAGGYVYNESVHREAQRNEYIQAVAEDLHSSTELRVAMVMGSFYESSYKHIGDPYIDKLGKGQPLTVCNGITGDGVFLRYYTPTDCYRLEKARYIRSEAAAKRLLSFWAGYNIWQRATFIDFIHNKGEGAFASSTMRRKANAGDIVGACRENPRWNKGTINGVSMALPGLTIRADANAQLCEGGL